MQIPSFLWMVLCLIAVTSSRTTRSTYNETGEQGSPLKSLHKAEDPAPVFDADFENGTYSEGDLVILHCFARGEKPMTYEWYYESGDLVEEAYSIVIVKDSNESYLAIDNVKLSDAGMYSCNAKNSHGISSKLFSVNVKPRGEISTSSTISPKVTTTVSSTLTPTVTKTVSSTLTPTVTTTVRPTGREMDAYVIALVAISVILFIVLLILACVMYQRYRVARTS